MPELNDMLEISANKVAHVIARSRETGVKAEAWDEDVDPGPLPGTRTAKPSSKTCPAIPARQELREFLAALNEDEQASLIALAWIGRGTYAPGELGEAISTAKAEHGANALRIPVQPAAPAGLFGRCPGTIGHLRRDAEEEILRPASI